jgi:chemotaxis protein MotB
MFVSSRRRRHAVLEIWPGFVDALASLLLVIIFVLMSFVVSQYFLAEAVSGRDQALARLTTQIDQLTAKLNQEKKARNSVQEQLSESKLAITELEKQLAALQSQLSSVREELTSEQNLKQKANEKITDLSAQIQALNEQIARLNEALESEEAKGKDQTLKIEDLSNRLNEALLSKVEELKALNEELAQLQKENTTLKKDKNKKARGLDHYRSEFFARLKKIIGNRSDIRVVGDRFIFQSEVLFDLASADLGEQGKTQLNGMVKALKEIAAQIPEDTNWILRVDGHTDKLPIKTPQFPSNWELSSARALSVVKYLVSQGIPPKHLVAAGFGEFQPLDDKADDKNDLARNRRIEFKLDQR